MGIGPEIIGLYTRLKRQGVFEGVERVIELGSQDVWTNNLDGLRELFVAFGRPVPDNINRYYGHRTGMVASRRLHGDLGLQYECIDLDGRHGAIRLDLDKEDAPTGLQGSFDLVTNHGTTEHVFNQYNAFKVMHDLTKPGALMLHAVPVASGYIDHGFFSYQPNLFPALAKANGYETLGMWVGSQQSLPDLWEWTPEYFKRVDHGPDATHLMVVLFRKMGSRPFLVPVQHWYEGTIGR